MINFKTEPVFKIASNDYVKEVEDEIELKLPLNYLSFMSYHNGGIPIENCFNFKGNIKVIEYFLSFVEDYKENPFGCYDIAVVSAQLVDRLGLFLVPIASLFGGDFICFNYENKEIPSVVFWDNEKSDFEAPYIEEITDSFESFLKMLYIHPDEK